MSSNYVSLARSVINRLESNLPNLKIHKEQCEAMVLEFVYIRDKNMLRGDNGESAAVFKELFRLACEAERVLKGCCCEKWLQAAVLIPNNGPTWSIFEIIRGELNRCIAILVEITDSSTVEKVRQRRRETLFESDQRNLREQLNEVLADRTRKLEDNLIARFLIARLDKNEPAFDGPADFVWINRRKGRIREWGDSEWDHVLGTSKPSDISTIPLEMDSGISSVTVNLDWVGIRVAEKAFKTFPDEATNIQLRWACLHEVWVMAKLNHPNVVRFISCSMEEGPGPAIIMECGEKTLEQHLRSLRDRDEEEEHRMSQITPFGRRAGPLLDLVVAVDILDQIASGMAYLHSQNVAHLDLKPANLLVTSCTEHEFLHVKIADFGHSMKGVEGKILNRFSNHGTTYYRAPELFYKGRMVCMKAADVCSFGFTCWEILHCQEPRLAILPPITCLDILQCTEQELELVRTTQPFYYRELVRGKRLNIDPMIPPELRNLIRRCWHTNPDNRPPFSEICLFFQSYKASLLGSHIPPIILQNRTEQQRSVIRRIGKAAKTLWREACQVYKNPLIQGKGNLMNNKTKVRNIVPAEEQEVQPVLD